MRDVTMLVRSTVPQNTRDKTLSHSGPAQCTWQARFVVDVTALLCEAYRHTLSCGRRQGAMPQVFGKAPARSTTISLFPPRPAERSGHVILCQTASRDAAFCCMMAFRVGLQDVALRDRLADHGTSHRVRITAEVASCA